MRIFLVGYMGSGKTTVGKLLAEQLGIAFVDSDQWIEEDQGVNVADLFDDRGEQAFRQLERDAIEAITSAYIEVVVATGGGLPCYRDNMARLNELGTTVYLLASIATIIRRIRGTTDRPLLAGRSDKEARHFVRQHLRGRRQYYRQACHIVRSLGSPKEVIRRITNKL